MTTNHPALEKTASPERSGGEAPLLDTQETSQPISAGLSYRTFLVSGSQKAVDFSEHLYAAVDERDDKKRAEAFRACRSSSWFVRHRVTSEIRLASSRCNLRWCPLCIKTKRYVMRQALIPWVKRAKKPKFVTLTLKHSDAPLDHQIKSLYKFFGILRRRPFWKKRITAGVWFFQIKRGKNDGLWHPHLHLICDGRYVPQKELSEAWDNVTGGSKIVDIRQVKDPKKAADYVSRYATAPCDLTSFSDDDAIEIFDSLHGRRICGSFGNCRDLQLVPSKCPDADDWEYMDSFGNIMFNRKRTLWAEQIYKSFISGEPCIVCRDPDPPPGTFEKFQITDHPIKHEQMVFEWSNFYKTESI